MHIIAIWRTAQLCINTPLCFIAQHVIINHPAVVLDDVDKHIHSLLFQQGAQCMGILCRQCRRIQITVFLDIVQNRAIHRNNRQPQTDVTQVFHQRGRRADGGNSKIHAVIQHAVEFHLAVIVQCLTFGQCMVHAGDKQDITPRAVRQAGAVDDHADGNADQRVKHTV